jgi:hypothetical protein
MNFNTFIKKTKRMSYYKIQNFEQYFKHYNKSVREPRKFWGKIAEENFTWYQQWDKVVEFDMAEAEINGSPKQKSKYKTALIGILIKEVIKPQSFLSE